MQVKFNNYAKKIGVRNDRDYFIWKVFVDESPTMLDKIASVQYLLDPSFPNPLRVSDDRENAFSIKSQGWGNFQIEVTVRFVDGSIYALEYFLDLKKPWPEETPKPFAVASDSIFINNVPFLYDSLKKAGREEEGQLLLKNFLVTSFNQDLDKKVDRFLSLPTGIFPADKQYFKVFWELNQVYINGLYYSTVVMAGVLCEKVCQDIAIKNHIKLEPRPISYYFEIFDAKQLAKPETLEAMRTIWDKRSRYLHEFGQEASYQDATMVLKLIGLVLKNEFQVTEIDLAKHNPPS